MSQLDFFFKEVTKIFLKEKPSQLE